MILGVSTLLGDKLSLGGTGVWRAVAQCQIPGTDGNWKNLVPGWAMVPGSPRPNLKLLRDISSIQ